MIKSHLHRQLCYGPKVVSEVTRSPPSYILCSCQRPTSADRLATIGCAVSLNGRHMEDGGIEPHAATRNGFTARRGPSPPYDALQALCSGTPKTQKAGSSCEARLSEILVVPGIS